MVSDIREASRKLAIVLAAGFNKFREQAQQDAALLQSLSSYFDPKVAESLCVPELVKILNSQSTTCPHGYHSYNCCYGCHQSAQNSAYSQFTLTGSFKKAATAAQTVDNLSKHFRDLAEQCAKIASERNDVAKSQKQKVALQQQLTKLVQKLVPLLKNHVLRVGIGKGRHLNISQGCGNVSTITKLFSYATVENAHRQLEDCRDRIVQELTMRKFEARTAGDRPNKVRRISSV
eukprot:gnl/TRDRNA2_/TRDRNA2_205038_c0_seq1.p1 gnl/TRDRNA2_/TRDRNA2_205038_c0~~gnl/TRDRNA2_/TRDRNA2_205038_c0_seq1.p1  ORF type:complete len:233 (+),score=28.33 gnl/TRDRNA2_/TRDRNA2_205038_c0_seq1:233-931(+)